MPTATASTPKLQLRRQAYKPPFGYEMGTLNPMTVVEVLDYLFNTTAWKSNDHLLRRKVQQWRERLFTDGPGSIGRGATMAQPTHSLFADPMLEVVATPRPVAPVVEDDTDPDAWIEEAIALRLQDPPMGWERIADTLRRPKTTVRRVIGQTMQDRGLAVGAG